MSTASTRVAGRAGALEDARQTVEARLGQKRRAALHAQLALAERGVAVAVRAERGDRVVDVQRAQPVEPDHAVELVEHLAQALGGADVVAAGEQVAGVEARSEPLAAAGAVDQRRKLLERPAQRAARAGGVLDVQGAAVGFLQRLGDRLGRPLDRPFGLALQRRAGMQHDADRPERRTRAQRRHQRGQRLLAHLLVLGRQVDQIDGVDEQRVEVRRLERLLVRGDLLVVVDGRLPLARALVEDLDRPAAALDSALDRFRRTAGGGDVCTDQHGAG